MSAQRIILINGSRLLGDMLRTVIYKASYLELVQEVRGDGAFPSAIENAKAGWVILALSSDKTIPGWVDQYTAKHPSMRFLAISPGSSKVKLKWLNHEEDLEDLSLNDLLHILEAHSQHAYSPGHPPLELQSG